MKNMLSVLFMFVSMSMMAAGPLKYGSEQIKAAFNKIGIDKIIPDSTLNADTVIATSEGKISLRICNGVVEHVGYNLFLKEQRTLIPSPVYDYLEFASLDIKRRVSENPFVYKNVKIDGGTWEDIIKNATNSRCDVTRLDNVAYRVEWDMGEKKPITITFPIGYEKLYMMSRSEIEKKFINELCSMKATQQEDIAEPDTSAFKKGRGDVLVLEGDHYIIMDVNQNLYYKKTVNEGLILIWDKLYPAESIANMFISHDKWLTGYPIKIRIPTHERKTEEVKVTVRQLLAYAHKTGCQAYWGLESLTETELKGTLFLYNPAYGFDHVFNISCDPRLIGSNDFEVISMATLFSPTTNIKNLFAESKGKSTPKKVE